MLNALIPCFQVRPTTTPRPWSGRKRQTRGDETEWDALAGSGATRGTRTTKKASRGSLSQVEVSYYHGLTLPSAIAEEISSINIAEASPSAADEDYLSEEDVRAEYLSRFDSSTVSMLNEETLLFIGPMARRSSLRRKGRWELRAAQRIMPCTHLGSTPSKTRSLSPSSTLNAVNNAHFSRIGATVEDS